MRVSAASLPDTLVIPDLHAPFMHAGAVDFLSSVAREVKPKLVVCLGDEVDWHRLSRYAHDPDLPSAGDELKRARKALRPIFKLFPTVKVCESNHTSRLMRTAYEAGIPEGCIQPIRNWLGAPEEWEWSAQWFIGDTLFLHGDGFSGPTAALKAAMSHRCNVVMGHVHTHAGVQYSAGFKDQVWGMNAGCLLDPASRAMAYAKYAASKAVLGCGAVVGGIPHFFPMR